MDFKKKKVDVAIFALLIVAFLMSLSLYVPLSLILTANASSLYARSTPFLSKIRPLVAATLVVFFIDSVRLVAYDSPFIIWSENNLLTSTDASTTNTSTNGTSLDFSKLKQ